MKRFGPEVIEIRGTGFLRMAGLMAIVATLGFGLANSHGTALGAVQQLQFEVASVKPDDPNARGQVTNHMPEFAGERVRAHSSRVLELILYAYNVKPYQVTGNTRLPNPPNLFDVDAKVEGSHSEDDVRLMFQSLLRDRFKLAAHWETRTLDGYRLTMPKGGAKLKPVSPHGVAALNYLNPSLNYRNSALNYRNIPVREGLVFMMVGADGAHLASNAAPISKLTSMLTNFLQMPLIDETGLAGTYDYAFDFTPDDFPPDQPTDSPTLANALKQETGLLLEKMKVPVKILVVDHVEKPTPN
jgi:uncharacterized protein (TIGR03435 family)